MPSNDFVRPMGVRPTLRQQLAEDQRQMAALGLSPIRDAFAPPDDLEAATEAHTTNGACQHTAREWRCPSCFAYAVDGKCPRCRVPRGAVVLVCEDCGEESQDDGKTWEPTEARIRRTQQEND